VLALTVVWLVQTNYRLDDATKQNRSLARANADAIAYLCQTNAIVASLTDQQTFQLQSEQLFPPRSIPRAIAISILRNYAETLRDTAPCVKSEKTALGVK
jgi:hypothetical protein